MNRYKVIGDMVSRYSIDLAIMGPVARIGIPGFFIGNTAEKILASINCSVLALKPDDCVSPVIE